VHDGGREGHRHSLVVTAALTYGANAGAAVLSLVNVLVVARTLGPTGRGDVAFLIAVATLGASVVAFGVQEANANIAALEVAARPRLATNSLLFAATFGTLGTIVAASLSLAFPGIGGDVEWTWFVIALMTTPIVLTKFYLQYLIQAEYGFAVTNVAWIAGPFTTAVTNGTLAALGMLSVASAMAAWIGGQMLGASILVVYVLRHFGFGRPDVRLAQRCLRFGVRVHLGTFMNLGNYRLDQWFVGVIAGSAELGHYSVAVAWAEVLFYVPGVLVLVQRPDLVRATRDEAGRLASRCFRYALLVAGAVSVGLIIFAPFLCTRVFGWQFAASVDDLRLLALAGSGIVALEVLGNALVAQRRPLLTTGAIGIAFAATLILDLALIPRYGATGAALATAVAWSIGGIAAATIFTRVLSVSPRELVPRRRDIAVSLVLVRDQARRVTATLARREAA
jgi:O-antigen/teichoic acid export membrane protein